MGTTDGDDYDDNSSYFDDASTARSTSTSSSTVRCGVTVIEQREREELQRKQAVRRSELHQADVERRHKEAKEREAATLASVQSGISLNIDQLQFLIKMKQDEAAAATQSIMTSSPFSLTSSSFFDSSPPRSLAGAVFATPIRALQYPAAPSSSSSSLPTSTIRDSDSLPQPPPMPSNSTFSPQQPMDTDLDQEAEQEAQAEKQAQADQMAQDILNQEEARKPKIKAKSNRK